MILSKKYKEEINKIVMNDAMKKRILQNVLAANENDNSGEKNKKAQIIVPKAKKYNNLKRNMQMVAAGFTVVLCLSIAKNYPMLLKNVPNDLKQNESVKSHDDENNDSKSSDSNKIVYNKDSKEPPDNNHKQVLNQNNNSDGNAKEESNSGSKTEQKESDTNSKVAQEKSTTSSEIRKEEKSKEKLQSSSAGLEAEKSQTSQNNDDKSLGNSNISSKTSPEENVNNKENNNPTSTMAKTDHGDIMLDKVHEDNTDSGVSSTSAVAEKDIYNNKEYKTLDEAEKALNLKVDSLKTLPKSFNVESISVISNEIIQVEYNDGSNNITFRGGKGIDNISGDYNAYKVKSTVKVNGLNVNLEGNKSDEYNLASWEKDGISYSISAEKGIDEKTILGMIS